MATFPSFTLDQIFLLNLLPFLLFLFLSEIIVFQNSLQKFISIDEFFPHMTLPPAG